MNIQQSGASTCTSCTCHGQILGGLEILKEMLKWRLNFL